jgi:hypothetical protein
MSLDGYFPGAGESGFEHLSAWKNHGDVQIATANSGISLSTTPDNAEHWRRINEQTGAIVAADLASGKAVGVNAGEMANSSATLLRGRVPPVRRAG